MTLSLSIKLWRGPCFDWVLKHTKIQLYPSHGLFLNHSFHSIKAQNTGGMWQNIRFIFKLKNKKFSLFLKMDENNSYF